MTARRGAWLGPLLLAIRFTGDAEKLPVKTYTAADGLPRDEVSRIEQDSRGFIWMIAGDGISRFDGYGFTNYTTDDGLPDRRVNDLLETRSGVTWIATESGLARFDPAGLRRVGGQSAPATRSTRPPLFAVLAPKQRGTPLAFNVLIEDSAGVIWCGTSEGLYRMDPRRGGTAPPRPVDLGMKSDGGVTALLKDRKGFLWIGTRSGTLWRLAPDGRSERYSGRHGLPNGLLTSLLETADGRIWLGAQFGLYELVAEPDRERSIVARLYTPRDGLASTWVMSLLQARDGRLWVATTAGLCLFTPSDEADAPRFRTYGARIGLCDQDVHDLAEDRDGNLWVASRCGAARVARNGFTGYGTDDGLTTLNINSIFEDHDGELIVVEYGGPIGSKPYGPRINRFDGTRFTGVTPSLPPRVTYFGWGLGQTTVQGRAREWWVPTGQGVYRFPAVKRVDELSRTRPRLLSGTGDDPEHTDVFHLYEDSHGDLWIAATGLRLGLWRWQRETESVHDFTPETGVAPGTEFAAFREDSAGHLWIGTSAGLLRYKEGRFRRFAVGDGVPPGWILSLYCGRGGRLWIGSQLGGLGRMDDPSADTPKIRTYTTADGLSSNNIRCVTEDEDGRIYVGTGHGVDRLEPPTGRIKRYTVADGLPRGSIENAYRDRRGALWFGSFFGLSRLVPGGHLPSPPPSVVITALRIAGAAQSVSELGEIGLPELRLASDQGNVSIDVVGLGASLGEELRYQYRLGDAEREWSVPTTDRTINYAHLAPGRYHFQARARNADGQVSRAPATFAFTIAAPLWMRWWFWPPFGLAIAAAAIALYKNRVARLLEVAAMRTRIATDLHDDIGANLTRISILSDVAARQRGDDPDSDQPLASISRIARESVASMGDIVWAIDPRRDSLLDLVRRMRRHAEEMFAGDTALAIEAPDTERDLKLGAAVRRDVLLIFKEAVNNAARHARPLRVAIAFRVDGSRLFLSIADDGVGFDTSRSSEGQGLMSMRRRASALGGALAVESSPPRGTKVTLTVPLGPTHASR